MKLCIFTWNKHDKFRVVGIVLSFIAQAKELGLWSEDSCIIMSSKDKNLADIRYTAEKLGVPFSVQKYDALEGVEDYKGNCLSLLLQSDTVLYEVNDKDVYMSTSARAMRHHLIEIDFKSDSFNFSRQAIAELFNACKN